MKTDIVLLNGGSSSGKTSIARELQRLLPRPSLRFRSEVAAAREASRPDRVVGMAEAQAEVVHAGVEHDLTVDTSEPSAAECAQVIARHINT